MYMYTGYSMFLIKIQINYQMRSHYPCSIATGKTIEINFRIFSLFHFLFIVSRAYNRFTIYNLQFKSDGSMRRLTIDGPNTGDWYAVAFISWTDPNNDRIEQQGKLKLSPVPTTSILLFAHHLCSTKYNFFASLIFAHSTRTHNVYTHHDWFCPRESRFSVHQHIVVVKDVVVSLLITVAYSIRVL